jgi:hypothetical protein
LIRWSNKRKLSHATLRPRLGIISMIEGNGGSDVSHDVATATPEQLIMDDWAIDKFIDWGAGKKGNKETKDALREEVNQVAADLAGPQPSPVELMLARTAAILWWTLRMHEGQYAGCGTADGGMTIIQSEHQQRRIDRTHRRLMSTIKTLATVRRLAVPAVQINVSRQQVNQVNVGEPGGA